MNSSSYENFANKMLEGVLGLLEPHERFQVEMEMFFPEYLFWRASIIAGDPDRWTHSRMKYQLPSFEYYLKNCIFNAGGYSDFRVRRWGKSNFLQTVKLPYCRPYYGIDYEEKTIGRTKIYSMWMGTMFNFEEIITIK